MYFIELWNKHHCQIWDKMWAETDQKEDVKLKTHFLWLRPFKRLAADPESIDSNGLNKQELRL